MPNPKLPFLAKFFFRSSYSFTLRPFSKISFGTRLDGGGLSISLNYLYIYIYRFMLLI